jgi:tryptophan-rich sensory protein
MLVGCIAICFAAAGLGSIATASSVDNWFADLEKPSFNPPNWIFAPVWTVLYLMMAAAAWLVWKTSGFGQARLALSWFAVQLGLNLFWSVVFFGMQEPGFALIEIVLLWISIAVTISVFARHSQLAAYLMTPYFLWVSFAAILNFSIWWLNRGA